MKLMKTIKICLKYRLLFIIPCFRELDEKKIEVEDERGIKRRKEESSVFTLSQSTKPVFSIQFENKENSTELFSDLYIKC